MELKSINNPVWVAFAIQHTAFTKQALTLVPTFLNEVAVKARTFSPTFFIMRALRDINDNAFAYVTFRSKRTPKGGSRESLFSSVSIVLAKDFDIEKPIFKLHIADFPDTTEGITQLATEVADALATNRYK